MRGSSQPGGASKSGLQKLGEREVGTAHLEEAVAAYRLALEEFTRERTPLEWATTQMNLGLALWALGEREAGTARLEKAVVAFDACLTVVASVWPDERVREVRRSRDDAQTEIARRAK